MYDEIFDRMLKSDTLQTYFMVVEQGTRFAPFICQSKDDAIKHVSVIYDNSEKRSRVCNMFLRDPSQVTNDVSCSE